MRMNVTSIGSKEDPCFACRAGFYDECHNLWHDEEPCGDVKFTPTGEVKLENSVDEDGGRREVDSGYIQDGYDSAKDLSDYKDPISTGRKRAAEMYPISPGMVCEWANLKKAGGGVVPIVGCVGRPASDRHHGPDKNTMNNAPGNLHRICDHCHNTWHALNDPHYGDRPPHTEPFLPKEMEWFEHDPDTRATMDEVLDAERKRLAEL